MYTCWRKDSTKRPTAPEIVDFLATNPRILAPCLDVPLASVQIEHTGQIELQLTENNRKFSLSWPPQHPTTISSTSGSSPLEVPSPLLLDINCHDEKQNHQDPLLGDIVGDLDSSRPLLLNHGESSTGPAISLQNFKRNQESAHKYVNIQPGMSLECPPERHKNAGTIQMEERTAMLAKNRNSEDVSIL